MKTKEEIINETKRRFNGEFCYTALKCAMDEYAKEIAISYLLYFCKTNVISECPPEEYIQEEFTHFIKQQKQMGERGKAL